MFDGCKGSVWIGLYVLSDKTIVHIGLPMTATTTLQADFFPLFSGDKIKYLGCFQPRGKDKETGLYRSFYSAVMGNEKGAIETVRSSIRLELDMGNTLIISEEMITVSQGKNSWKVNLERLGKILKGFDYQLIVSVREPVDALFSYYVEVYHQLPFYRKSFTHIALNDERMHIYHYKKLLSELLKHFARERVNYIQFEDIIAGNLGDIAKKVCPNFKWNNVVLKNSNTRKKTADYVVTEKEMNLLDVMRKVSSLNIFWQNNTVARVLHKIQFGQRKIFKPSEKELLTLQNSLLEDKKFIEKMVGNK